MRISVIGAGIVGMATALSLQMEGHEVTVFDPRPPGTACSYGNSGGIGIGLVAPIAMPGIGRQALRLLLDPDEPLFIEPRHLWRKAGWFWRYWLASRPARVRHISVQRAALNHAVLPTLQPLLARAGAGDLLQQKGMLFVFAAAAPSAVAAVRFRIAEAHGIRIQRLGRRQVEEVLPALAQGVGSGVLIGDNWHCTDPGGLVQRFAEAFRAGGGRLEAVAVAAIEAGNDVGVRTLGGVAHRADRVVLCAGVWSKDLLAGRGYRVPLEAERGYHLMLPTPGIELGLPITLADRNIVMTPMRDGLRITGIAEFAEPDSPPRFERAHNLLRQASRHFPALDGTGAVPWVGPRPSTPDSLPVIGPLPGEPRIVLAFGHGQSGLAHASVTGALVADICAGRAPRLPLVAFGLERFQ